MPAFYKAGTVSTAAGSAVVNGNGTAFYDNNVRAGMVFLDNENKAYEIAAVPSNTQLVLARPYGGAGGAGQVYAIQPTQSFAADLADAFNSFKNTYQAYIDTVLQGAFLPGSQASPGVRSTIDGDTGIRWFGNNALALVAGGLDRLTIDGAGTLTTTAGIRIPVNSAIGNNPDGDKFNNGPAVVPSYGFAVTNSDTGVPKVAMSGYYGLDFYTLNTLYGRMDSGGNLLIGVQSGANHTLFKPVNEGGNILTIGGNGNSSATFLHSQGSFANGTPATLLLNRNGGTGRSLNAGGTLNASGADYAEYMLKANGCGEIAKGDICGVNAEGKLTRTWGEAVSYVIKSTDPSYVGGDTWFDKPAPINPGDEPDAPPPVEPGSMPDAPPPAGPLPDPEDFEAMAAWAKRTNALTRYADEFEAWRKRSENYPEALAEYNKQRKAWTEAKTKYDADLAEWEAEMEQARQRVDRIAFCGQVPANLEGDFAVGDYVVAAANGKGIKGVAVAPGAITFDQYRARIGKIWAVRDGRAWIDVQHG